MFKKDLFHGDTKYFVLKNGLSSIIKNLTDILEYNDNVTLKLNEGVSEIEDDLESLKNYIESEFKSFVNKNYDDKIIAEQLRIISRSFIKQKYGLKPLTSVEIVRI